MPRHRDRFLTGRIHQHVAAYPLFLCLTSLWIAVALPQSLEGTYGFSPSGYGVRADGMGGTAAANPQDGLVVFTNPAGISFLKSRIDLGVLLFHPSRSYSYTKPVPDDVLSQRDLFAIPGIAAVKRWDASNTFGVALYGRGGLNTTYPRDNPVFGNGVTNQIMGVDQAQLLLSTTYSRDINSCHSLGISLLCSVQRLTVRGLQRFRASSSSPGDVTNRGYDYSEGVGVRVGWLGQVAPSVKLGLSYASKIFSTRFKKYQGIIAERGTMDTPAELTAGISWQPTKCWLFAFDYQYLFNKDVKALGNEAARLSWAKLGDDEGPGFGWNNVSAYKFGVNYQWSREWEVRAGCGHGSSPYRSSEIDFNILAPAVSRNHYHLGASYHIDGCNELALAYIYAAPAHQEGESHLHLGTITESMTQHSFAFSYSRTFD